MNLQFGEKEQVVQLTEKILVLGREVGEIKDRDKKEEEGSLYHAIIGGCDYGSHKTPLLQGFGDTKEQAVIDAFKRGRIEAAKTMKFIECLEAELSV